MTSYINEGTPDKLLQSPEEEMHVFKGRGALSTHIKRSPLLLLVPHSGRDLEESEELKGEKYIGLCHNTFKALSFDLDS